MLQRWSFEEVIATYDISEHEGIRMMPRFDRMNLIEMLPGNRYKLLISRNFNWIKSGPIQNFFERQLQADYFESKFNKPSELRLFYQANAFSLIPGESHDEADQTAGQSERLAY